MAGIYVHVPFCKKKCFYCDFYSIGLSEKKEDFINNIIKELELRKSLIVNEVVETIYFGGGTPSLLSADQIDRILKKIDSLFPISGDPEITLEANPDDITKDLLEGYKQIGVNRLSIGIQSFIDEELTFLGRRHNVESAVNSVKLARLAGFNNISIDLIYGLPNSTIKSWDYSLKQAFSLGVEHLSCYHLTYEQGTPLYRKLEKKQLAEIDDTLSENQFLLLRKRACENEFIHYEISNLAKDGFFSRHNTSYWKGICYLGVGPAAHSYNGSFRQWNPKSYKTWVTGLEAKVPSIQGEELNINTKFNEKLLTNLRTIWGVDLGELRNEFGDTLVNQLLASCDGLFIDKKIIIVNNHLVIPNEHLFVSDGIISDLLIV